MKNTLSILLVFSLLVTICFSCFTLVSSAEDSSVTNSSSVESKIANSSFEIEDESSETSESNQSSIEDPIFYGDANEDKHLDMKDVLVIRRFMAHMEVPLINEKQSDVNADLNIDMKDVLLLRKYLAHMITSLGPNSVHTVITYYEDGIIETKSIYDENDFLIEFFEYDTDGTLFSHVIYKNDETGRCIFESTYHEDDVFFSAYSYEYNEDGSIITSSFDENNIIQWTTTIDVNGNLLEELDYVDGVLDTTTQYTYDENGNISTYKVYKDEVLIKNESYLYDENAALIEKFELDENGEMITRYTYTYVSEDPNVDDYYAYNQYNKDNVIIYSYIMEIISTLRTTTYETTIYTDEGIINQNELEYFIDDKIVNSVIRYYDEEGQLLCTETTTYNEDESIKQVQISGDENYTIDYSYLESGDIDVLTYKDVDGNIIKTETYNYDEETMECISYTIDYYENGIVVNSETIYLEENESSEDELQEESSEKKE